MAILEGFDPTKRRTAFEEIMNADGADQPIDYALRDVHRALPEGAVREQNVRRGAVSGRTFMGGRGRGLVGQMGTPAPTAAPVAQPTYEPREPTRDGDGLEGRGPSDRAGGYDIGEFGYGGFTGDEGYTGVGGGAVPNYVMGNLLKSAGGTALGAMGAGMALGIKPGAMLNPAIGMGMKSLTGLGAANTLAGGILSSEIGDYAYESDTPEDFGPGAQDAWDYDEGSLREAGRQANLTAGGALGIGARAFGSYVGDKTGLFDMDSPVDVARQGIDQAKADHVYAAAPDDPSQIAGRTLTDRIVNAIGLKAPGPDAFTAKGQMGQVGRAQASDIMKTLDDGTKITRGSLTSAPKRIPPKPKPKPVPKPKPKAAPKPAAQKFDLTALTNAFVWGGNYKGQRWSYNPKTKQFQGRNGMTVDAKTGEVTSGTRETGMNESHFNTGRYDFYGNRRRDSGGGGGYTGSGAGTGGGRGGEHETESGGYGGMGGV